MIDPDVPNGELIRAAGLGGLVLEVEGPTPFALIPLDDDLIDYLIERSPKFIEDCQKIRERMRGGSSISHAEVRQLFS